MKRFSLSVLIVVIFFPGGAFADGKFFGQEKVPPGIPYQRAFIAHNGEKELLIVQSKFDGKAREFGWVVPVPSVPEVSSMEADKADWLFRRLEMQCYPEIINIKMMVFIFVGILFVFLLGLQLLVRVHSSMTAWKPTGILGEAASARWVTITIIVGLIAVIVTPSLLTARMSGSASDVEVLDAKKVGVYDVKVIKAKTADGLIGWLKERKYSFDKQDRMVFQDYIDRNWCFVTARVSRDKSEDSSFSSPRNLVNPLALAFDTKEAVYPMALTGTIGSDILVTLYVLSDGKRDYGDKLKIRYAGVFGSGDKSYLFSGYERSAGNPWPWIEELSYLTKLKGSMTPEQMSKDIVLKKAKDNSPYRERIYRW